VAKVEISARRDCQRESLKDGHRNGRKGGISCLFSDV
jgi:hypothetical protein